MCYGLVWREGKSAGSFITFPILNQFPFLLIRFPLKDVVSVELEFFDAFPDVIKCSERELKEGFKVPGYISSYAQILMLLKTSRLQETKLMQTKVHLSEMKITLTVSGKQ